MHRYVLATHGWPKDMKFLEMIVLRDSDERPRERYDYEQDKWVYDVDSWWRHCMNSNDYEDLTEQEARKIIEKNGGTNFDR